MNGVEKPLTVDDDLPKLVDACELSDSDDEQGYEENDEEEDRQEYQSLFGQKVFSNIKDLFSFESQEFKFDLVDVIDRYNMTMMDYIKMVNFIRSEKPDVSIFKKNYSSPSEIPWNDDRYLKTVLESDPVLQFDIEEDLDILGLKKDNNNNHLIAYQKRIAQLESREEELIEMVSKLRNLANNLLNPKQETNLNDKEYEEDDSCYVNSYSNYSIHLEMLQDRVRTESYMNAILNNPNVFKDKIVLDVGCGTGILSLFAAKAGAKRVIAVDMSDIIDKAIQIADENGMKDRITFLKGKVEEVKLPVDSVDIIISEWMGYFLLFESMLDSVLFARDKYLRPDSGLVLPNFFEMHLFAVSDVEIFEDKISFWSNVYGFKMNSMTEIVRHDAQVLTLESSSVKSEMFKFKEIDCSTVRCEDLNKFSSSFELTINEDCELTGIGTSFETYFNSSSLENKVHFSTSPHHKSTHWQQTLFQFDKTYSMKKDSTLKGVIKCKKNPNYSRGYLVELEIFDRVFKYKID